MRKGGSVRVSDFTNIPANAHIDVASNTTILCNEKSSLLGCKIIITPAKPAARAIQRNISDGSRKKIIANKLVKSGALKLSAVAKLSGKVTTQ